VYEELRRTHPFQASKRVRIFSWATLEGKQANAYFWQGLYSKYDSVHTLVSTPFKNVPIPGVEFQHTRVETEGNATNHQYSRIRERKKKPRGGLRQKMKEWWNNQ
jgi:hypothetical protein